MKTQKNRWIALGVAGLMTAGTLGGATVNSAEASAKGRRNTTAALGAITAYSAIKGNNKAAIAGAAGTAWAYKRYSNQKKREEAARRWNQRRNRNWRR